jgi:hypothetical protein
LPGEFNFISQEGAPQMTLQWRLHTQLNGIRGRICLYYSDKAIGPVMEQSLENLKNSLEKSDNFYKSFCGRYSPWLSIRCDAHIFDKSISELRVATSRDAKHHLMDVVTEANLPLFSSYKVSTVLKHPAS